MADSINAAIYELLTTARDLPDLVGLRVYPVKLPQNVVYPAIVFTKAAGARAHSQDGASGFNKARFEFDVWADSLKVAGTIAQALRLILDGYRGDGLGISIQGAFLDFEEEGWDDERAMFFVSQDYEILHNETNQVAP